MICRFALISLLISNVLLGAQQSASAEVLLRQADRMADLYNWVAAGPVYARAEVALLRIGDRRNALYAHIGYLRSTMETASLPALSRYFATELANPLVTNDPLLEMKCLIAKGDVDAEIDSAPAQADWEGVLRLAKQLNDSQWQSRAIGEIGFHRYVQGDHTGAMTRTSTALIAAHKRGDFAAEIRFLSGIGTGLELAQRHSQALDYLEKALLIAKQHPEIGYPYMAVAGKVMALIVTSNFREAKSLIADQTAHAVADHRMVKVTQARLFAADMAIAQGKSEQAIQILNETVDIAKGNGTRLLTDVYSKLTNLYRERGDLRRAEESSTRAIASMGGTKDMYLAPELLLTLARLKLALGKESEGRLLLARATDVVEAMLTHTGQLTTRDALLTTMSTVYTARFALAAEHNNVTEAFTEQARWISNVPKQGVVRARLLSRPPVIALQQVQNVLRPDELLFGIRFGRFAFLLSSDRSIIRSCDRASGSPRN
jgi:tetratricopeptide (TPR) repeat protein